MKNQFPSFHYTRRHIDRNDLLTLWLLNRIASKDNSLVIRCSWKKLRGHVTWGYILLLRENEIILEGALFVTWRLRSIINKRLMIWLSSSIFYIYGASDSNIWVALKVILNDDLFLFEFASWLSLINTTTLLLVNRHCDCILQFLNKLTLLNPDTIRRAFIVLACLNEWSTFIIDELSILEILCKSLIHISSGGSSPIILS
jgi:hypothetical protein